MLRGQSQLPCFLDAGKGHYVCCCMSYLLRPFALREDPTDSMLVLFLAHGDVITWGINDLGQLGHGDKQTRSAPTFVTILLGSKVFISSVACGENHTLALSREGICYSWGSNRCGQLGRSTERGGTRHDVPSRVGDALNNKTVSFISCGTEHSAAVSSEGELFAFVFFFSEPNFCFAHFRACTQLGK
jgi:alpha-tubulin suppressor-like RCC1 family protein